MNPTVSVILPVKNGAAFIQEALESVVASLQDTPAEIIVVNDGSTDNTEEVLEPWRKKITYISQESKGPGFARNKGLKKAQGDFIAFIDADDVWTTNHFSFLHTLFSEHSEAQIVMGYTQRFSSPVKQNFEKNLAFHRAPFGEPVLLPTFGSALFRAACFDTIGEIESSYFWHEDVDWYLKAIEAGMPLKVSREVVNYYRIHSESSTHDMKPNNHQMLKVLATSLARRGHKTLPSLKEFEI